MRKIIMFFLVLVVLVISCKKEEESTYTNTPSGTDCPTTSACGCSNLNQADCIQLAALGLLGKVADADNNKQF